MLKHLINRKVGEFMKNVFQSIAGMLLIITLAACGGTTELPKSNDVPSSEPPAQEEVEPLTPDDTAPSNKAQEDANIPETHEPVSFEPNENVRVVATFIYDNDTYIVVENTGEQAVLNYRVAYINYDKNGFVSTNDSDGYQRGKADTVNLMPGSKTISSWYGAKGAYADAAVVGIDFADGSTWEATEAQIDAWASESNANFSIETQKEIISTLKETSTLAETNEYAALTDYTIKHENQFSSQHDFHFSIDNISGQGITRLNVFVLEYDENGFPVSVSPYDTYCANGHQTGGTVNLAVGQSGSYHDDLFLSPTTTQIKVIISYIEFQDGTDWTNPYVYEWIIGNNGNY